MNLVYQIHGYGILVSYSCDIALQSINKNFGAPTPSCFVNKQVNANPGNPY